MIIAAKPTDHQIKRLELQAPFEDLHLSYVDWGAADSGKVALCVHGLTRNSRDFDSLARHLVSLEYRVIAVDVAGRGNSAWLSDPAQYVVPTYAAQLAQLVQLLEIESLVWIGTSMGGIIGMILAAGGETFINRLVLNDVGPFVPAAALQEIQAYVGMAPRFETLEELEQHLRRIHAPFGALTDDQWRHLATHSSRETKDGWVLSYDPEIRIPFAEASGEDVDIREVWEGIRCPVLVLHGEESRLLSREVCDRMQATGPRASVVHLPGIGHAPALMSLDQHMAISDWLEVRDVHAAR